MFPVYRLKPADSRYSGIVLVAANTPLEADKFANEFLENSQKIQGKYCVRGFNSAESGKEKNLMSDKEGIILDTLYFKDSYAIY